MNKEVGSTGRRSTKDHTGKTSGQLMAVERLEYPGNETKYRCICTCGNTTNVRGSVIASGRIRSCGCVRNGGKPTHRMSGTPEYHAFMEMWMRCTNPKNKDYPRYKDRRPPEAWRDFSVFFAELGLRPDKTYSLDRIDNDKPYGPNNVRWATVSEQNSNRKSNVWITHSGATHTVMQWAKLLGVPPKRLYLRLSNGWSADRVLETPKGGVNAASL